MFPKKLTSQFKKQGFTRTLLGILLTSIITTPIIGYQAYRNNYESVIQHEEEHVANLANTIRDLTNTYTNPGNIEGLIHVFRDIWNNINRTNKHIRLRLITRNGKIILDSAPADQQNKYITRNPFKTESEVDLFSLAKEGRDWQGYYLSADGTEWVTSFVYIPAHDISVAIQVQTDDVAKILFTASLPWIAALSLLGMALFPFAIWLLHNAYLVSQKNLRENNRSLNSEIENRIITEKSLDLYRLHLETLVQQRTTELVNARDFAVHADKIKSDFLANMSHELRTPLNSILCFTEIVKSGKAGSVNNEQQQQLSMAHNSAEHLLNVINNILDISKVDAGKDFVHDDVIRLQDLSDEILGLVLPLAESKSLKLELESAGLMFHQIHTDIAKLKQILINLLGNAIKFTQQGQVTLRFSIYGLKNLRIDVKDSGIGIESEILPFIFEPFTQADNSSTRSHDGSGLGLAISKRYAELLQGSLSVESSPGRGSTFTLFLPDVLIL